MAKRRLQGIVVSSKMLKTLVVMVWRIKKHQKYKRRYRSRKRYKVHTEEQGYNVGDVVVIQECNPISKDKKWKVIKKIRSGAGAQSSEMPETRENQQVEQIVQEM